jgi:DNA-binding beta-propeller fold protein YncE
MSLRHLLLLVGYCCIACTVGVSLATPDKPIYTVSKSVPLGAPDRWDLLSFDEASHRVYVAHGDRVTVIDGESGALVGQVEGFPGGTHGIALVPKMGRGYGDDGHAGTATSFDLKTLALGKPIKADDDADAIVFDPASGHVFVIDGDPGKVTVIDPKTDTALTTIDGGGKLEIAVADGSGMLFVNGEAKQEIVRIDTRTNKVTAHWPIPQCTSPHGLAIDPRSRRLFASCENNVLLALDADNGKVVASLPIGARTDGAAFDPVRKRIFSSNGDGTLTVIVEKSADSFEVLANVQTKRGARTMTLDPKSGRLYLVAAETQINEAAAPTDLRHRFTVVPGTAKLLFLDPTP